MPALATSICRLGGAPDRMGCTFQQQRPFTAPAAGLSAAAPPVRSMLPHGFIKASEIVVRAGRKLPAQGHPAGDPHRRQREVGSRRGSALPDRSGPVRLCGGVTVPPASSSPTCTRRRWPRRWLSMPGSSGTRPARHELLRRHQRGQWSLAVRQGAESYGSSGAPKKSGQMQPGRKPEAVASYAARPAHRREANARSTPTTSFSQQRRNEVVEPLLTGTPMRRRTRSRRHWRWSESPHPSAGHGVVWRPGRIRGRSSLEVRSG